MKKTVLFVSLAVLVVNILAGLLLSGYHVFNVLSTSAVVVLTAALMYIAENATMKDAFRVSLPFIFGTFGIVMFFLMLFSRPQLQDNWCVIVSLIIALIEVMVMYVTYRVSKHFN